MSKVESVSFLVGAGKGYTNATGMDLGPGWLEFTLTTLPFVAGAARSVKNTMAPNASSLGEIVTTLDESEGPIFGVGEGEEATTLMAIPAGAVYGAAKAGFFMGLGYSAGYLAGQFVNK